MKSVGLALVACAMAQSAFAQTIDCSFPIEASATFESNRWRSASNTTSAFSITFTDLNPAERSASLIGNLGRDTVVMLARGDRLIFFQTVPAGVSVTTVYLDGPARGVAIHSRQMLIVVLPTASQLVGRCTIRE